MLNGKRFFLLFYIENHTLEEKFESIDKYHNSLFMRVMHLYKRNSFFATPLLCDSLNFRVNKI